MHRQRASQGGRPQLEHPLSLPVVQHPRGEKVDPTVAVLGVVPGEKDPAETQRAVQRVEAVGESGAALCGLGRRFAERSVVAGAGQAVRLSSGPEIGEPPRHQL